MPAKKRSISEMQRYGERFNHNIQSLRLVDHLERRYPRFPGLNLTFEVREGIVKHSRDLVPGESPALDRVSAGTAPSGGSPTDRSGR